MTAHPTTADLRKLTDESLVAGAEYRVAVKALIHAERVLCVATEARDEARALVSECIERRKK